MTESAVATYNRALVADVIATADAEDASVPEVFTRRVLDDLEQAGETENSFAAYYNANRTEVSGYGTNDSMDALDLYITSFSDPELSKRLVRSEVESTFRRLTTFLTRCRDGLRRDLDEASDVHDMCLAVEKALPAISKIRLFLLTNRESAVTSLATSEFDGLPLTFEVWDIVRLHRMASSGSLSEPINVDFDPPLPCLRSGSGRADYEVVLAILPGQRLAELYSRHGTRLLELNVRSFLQTRNQVNNDIRRTLIGAPERFLAYNNGVTATATQVEYEVLPDRGLAITRIHDLQIVNGGQTTASLHYAHTRDKADLSGVDVQMKLNIVAPGQLAGIVPDISRFSNNQSKVTYVDLSSNHPYHVQVEKITRSLWAPAVNGGQQTRWFYERARGQYADDLARERTLANQRKFKALNPPNQKFGKADLAKFLHCWDQLPHLVSRGSEKNFREFTFQLGEFPVDVRYCTNLLAKAVLFKRTDAIVRRQNFGGYKINIVAYTIARLAQATDQRLNLDAVWRAQDISPTLAAAINDLCVAVHRVIIRPKLGSHVGEWAKKAECWEAVLGIQWQVPDALRAELVDAALPDDAASDTAVAEVTRIPAKIWFTLALWAKEGRHLEPSQHQLASHIAGMLRRSEEPSQLQATKALRALEQARGLGFHTALD